MLSNRRLSLLLAICVTIFGLSRIAAQDATPISPPTETSLPTLPPTEIPTDLPSATPLPTLTFTPTPLPTETPPLLPTPTASETATETPTETPTLPASASPTETLTATPSLSPTSSPTATLTASPSATASLMPTATTVQSFPTMPPPPNYGQLLVAPLSAPGNDVIEYRGIDTVSKFTTAINTANIDCAHTHVLYVSPGPYPLTPVNSTSLGLEITSKVVIVGNNMDPSKQVNDPIVAAIDKVIFTPAVSGKGVFSLPGNPGTCGSLTLYNVVITGAALTAPNAGGAVNAYDNLSIYNSLLKDNKVIGWGGAIYQGSDNLKIINSVFDNNQSTGNYTNTGGGAVVTQYAATFDSQCTTYKNNYSHNVGGAFYFYADSGTITFKHLLTSGAVDTTLSNNFENNTATNGWGGFYSLPAVDATNQYWNPAPSTVAGNTNSVFGTSFNPVLGTSVLPDLKTGNCIVPPIPTTCILSDLRCQTKSELAKYHIVVNDIAEVGNPNVRDGAWTDAELAELLTGVQNTAQAFKQSSTFLYSDNANAFLNMLMFKPNYDHIEIEQLNNTNTTCLTTARHPNGITQTASRAIISCGGGNVFTQYTATHELGHVFLNQTADDTPILGAALPPCKPLIECIKDPNPSDINSLSLADLSLKPKFIFGRQAKRYQASDIQALGGNPNLYTYDDKGFTTTLLFDWERGTRGWGSGAPNPGACAASNGSSPSSFQQNPCKVIQWIDTSATAETTEQEETGADMFLNWVYRTITQINPNPDGFENADWIGNTCASINPVDINPQHPCYDIGLPGDTRFTWMNTLVIPPIFTYFGW